MKINEILAESSNHPVILDETAEENQVINIVSDFAAESISNILAKKSSPIKDFFLSNIYTDHDRITIWGMPLSSMNIPEIHDPVVKAALNKMKIHADVTRDPGAALASYGPSDNSIIVNIGSTLAFAKRKGLHPFEVMKSSIAHEMQHAIDAYKSKRKAFKVKGGTEAQKNAQTDDNEYQNYLRLPYEVNARFAQALLSIATQMKTSPNDLLPAMIMRAFSEFDLNKIYQKNQPEYKRLLTRAYKFFDAEKNNPKQTSPQSMAKRALAWITGKSGLEIK